MKRVSKQEVPEVTNFLSNSTEASVRASRSTELIPADQLKVDPSYQRKLNTQKVDQIVRDFCWYLVNPVKVAKREDGTYWIFDGNHTTRAIVKKTGNKAYPIECLVYDGLPYAVENALFTYQTGYSSGLSVKDEFRACEKREVPDVLAVTDALNEAGVPLKSGGTGAGIQRNAWIVPLYNAVGDRAKFVELLKLAYEFDEVVRKDIAWGIWEFMKEYKGMITFENLSILLDSLDADDLRAEASKYHARMGGAKHRSVTKLLVEYYSDQFNVDLPRYYVKTGQRGN